MRDFAKFTFPTTCTRPFPQGAVITPGPERAQRAVACPCESGRCAIWQRTASPTTYARPAPGRRTRPERSQRQASAPAGGSLRISRKHARRPRRCHPDPSRPPGCSLWQTLAGSLRISRQPRPPPPTGPYTSQPTPKPAARRPWTAPQPTRNSAGARHSARSAILPFCAPRVSRKKEIRKKRKTANRPRRPVAPVAPGPLGPFAVFALFAVPILACPPHRGRWRFLRPARSCQGARPGAGEILAPRSLLPSRGSSARRRRQHLQRRHRPGIRVPKELPPLRLGHVRPPRAFPRRPLIGHPCPRVIVRLVFVDPPQPGLHRQRSAPAASRRNRSRSTHRKTSPVLYLTPEAGCVRCDASAGPPPTPISWHQSSGPVPQRDDPTD